MACDHAFLGGSSTWARTRDLRINSPALYRLSYRGMYSVLSSKKHLGGKSPLRLSPAKSSLNIVAKKLLRPEFTCFFLTDQAQAMR